MIIGYIVDTSYKWRSGAIHKDYRDHLFELGHTVFTLTTSATLFEMSKLIEFDQVWIVKSSVTLTPEEYSLAKERGIKVIYIGLSDPTLFDPKRIGVCDFYATSALQTFDQLLPAMGDRCIPFPLCMNPKVHVNLDLPKSYDAVFVGIGDHPFSPDRIDQAQQLHEYGIDLHVFGPDWKGIKNSHPYVDGPEMIRVLNSAHLCIDLSARGSSMSHRIFEASGCGTPVLTLGRPELLALFDCRPNASLPTSQELILYTSFGDCIEQALKYLAKPELLRAIGTNARTLCLGHHNVSSRVAMLLDKIKETT